MGLCCKFYKESIRFRVTTAKYLSKFSRLLQLARLSELCLVNAESLLSAIEYCGSNNIGCFRVNSQILPLKTQPDVGYDIDDLPQAPLIKDIFSQCRLKAVDLDVRLTFHPDQFILLSAVDAGVVNRSIEELEYQAQVSSLIGADVINIHGGGGYGDKRAALERAAKIITGLNKEIRDRLTIENDDRVYTPFDLLGFCRDMNIPFVYDVHHHRCLPDGMSVAQVTQEALETWDREPLVHISSPKYGWGKSRLNFHADYIDIKDFPCEWKNLNITVEVEAKAKELAVKKLYNFLQRAKI